MKKVYKGCFVTLANDILQYGKISKAGTNGIITNIENGTPELITDSYSLLVSWENRVREATHEREALLKSARKLLAQLEEDIDVLKLLRREINVRLNRQEQELAA